MCGISGSPTVRPREDDFDSVQVEEGVGRRQEPARSGGRASGQWGEGRAPQVHCEGQYSEYKVKISTRIPSQCSDKVKNPLPNHHRCLCLEKVSKGEC